MEKQTEVIEVNNKRCVIIGASPDADPEFIKNIIKPDDHVVCADGGHLLAVRAGIKPALIAGDFDSSEKPSEAGCEIIALPCRKDDTDTMYLIRHCLSEGYREFLLLGMTGGRLDHTYANFCVLEFLNSKGAHGVIADNSATVEILREGSYIFEGKAGYGFSIFPFGCSEAIVTLEGFEYDLDRGRLTSDFPIGVSNRIISPKATLTIHRGILLSHSAGSKLPAP